jgi:eukaryotic-like serine/threonine-protein kinase
MERVRAALAERYRVERPIGRGGMGTVVLAQDLRHGRQVAIKVLNPGLGVGPERFLREIEIAASLAHPNILPVHDSGTADGLLYYVMPYVEGESLRHRLQREVQLPLEDALAIVREIGDALGYAHARGVVHRDIEGSISSSGEAGAPRAECASGTRWDPRVSSWGQQR